MTDQFKSSKYGQHIAALGLSAEKAAQQLVSLMAMYSQAQLTVQHFQLKCKIQRLEAQVTYLKNWVWFLAVSLIDTVLLFAYYTLI